MALRHHLALAFAAPALVIPHAAVPAHAYTPPAPPTKTLPKALDVYVPYQGQTVCDPVARPGVLAFAKLMTSHYQLGSTSLIGRSCAGDVSEHYDGRAWDWMLDVDDPEESAVARSVLTWLTKADANGVPGAMARRFGIMYIIYDRKMWRSYAPERGWAPYDGSNPHTDHIHFSFNYNGAAARTSWWTGAAATTVLTSLPGAGTTTVTIPAPAAVLSFGMQSEAVRQLQVRLGNLPTTGYFGSMTRARVTEYQQFAGLPQTGIADLKTQEILARRGWRTVTAAFPTLSAGTTSSAVKTLQTKLGALPTTGYYGSLTKARVLEYQKFVGLPATGTADPVTQYRLWVRGWTAATAEGSGTPTTYPTLSFGMTSTAVKKLQTELGGLPTTGYFGPLTQARVTDYQKAVGLRATGVADHATQELLYTKGWPRTYPTLSFGMTSTAVKNLQAKLGELPTTGYFGPLTKARVVEYQRFLGLSATGVADNRTQQLLYTRGWSTVVLASTVTDQEGTVVTAFATAPQGSATLSPGIATVSTTTTFTPFKDLVLGQGSRGAAVRTLQRALGGVAVDGVFGAVTRDKVTALQRSVGLAQTGVVTSDVWDALEAKAFPFAAHRTTVLRLGDTGPEVSAIQRVLGVRVTGVFDESTRVAIKEAQAKAGLASTGVVASRTWSLFDRLAV
ncbi:peptidoglycan-binding protein [Intrasporangium calvum]|uniref:Peptidoglycan-binding protein n=1 Tax=Intrasporangium calvum TaxID=53358 RepID=A0ABT5GHQ3_9MICO|nr:peptidoglycan-binding protein [Intrasporangium calvum]MDC5697638.1 peptidoglycan-binding protein [Intrasporangium calvum]